MNADSARWTLLRHGEFGNQNLCKGGNTKKMKKKTLTIAIALVLVVALAVGATWAYLTAQTGPVVNTFTAGGAVNQSDLELFEHVANQKNDGTYALGEATTTAGNAYVVMPGVNLPKDPTVNVKAASGAYYLFVEVTKGAKVDGDTLGYTVDGSKWINLNIAGREVYAYTADGQTPTILNAALSNVTILAGNTITVSGNEAKIAALTADNAKLTFKAYACQAAGFADAAAAFTECF